MNLRNDESKAVKDILWNLKFVKFIFLSLKLADQVEHAPRMS